MGAASSSVPVRALGGDPARVTLLDLVRAVSESAKDEREVVATVRQMLKSGVVRLGGTFREVPVEDL